MPGKDNMQKQLQPRAMKKMYALGKKRPLDLSLSENPLGCSPMVSRALKTMQVDLHDYPAANGQLLKQALAIKFGLTPQNFFIANGSESIINDLPRIFGNVGDTVVVPFLTFPMFKICSELASKQVLVAKMTPTLGCNLAAMKQLITSQVSIVFLCNPNNPTGSVLLKRDILNFIESIASKTLVVVDEANIEFGGESLVDQVANIKNLLVLRTFSKGYGLANLRVGYAVAGRAIIQKLEEETPLFQVSGLSEKLAVAALADTTFIETTKQFVSGQRALLSTALTNMGCTVFPSEANNLFVRLPKSLRATQFAEQLEENGVSLILGSNFEGFSDSFFRLSIRSAQTNQAFLAVMKGIVFALCKCSHFSEARAYFGDRMQIDMYSQYRI